MEHKSVTFVIDSNDRFNENFRNCPFWKLPHDENGCNRLLGTNKDGVLYWRNKKVLTLEDIPNFDKDTTFYSKFITDKGDGNSEDKCG